MAANRSLSQILKALCSPEHYHAAWQMLRVYKNPLDGFRRYLLGRGDYPAKIPLRTPTGDITLTAYSHHDILTINEIFCREDYFATKREEIFVDFGSNIGASAAYFLTRGSSNGFTYLYEPVPTNVDRLRKQLSFTDRFSLEEAAVGTEDGIVRFGTEETGRYGGIGVRTDTYIEVRCIDSNEILRKIIAAKGKIDILKIDIEGFEATVVTRIPADLLQGIGTIYAECTFSENPIAATHTYKQYGSVAQFRMRRHR